MLKRLPFVFAYTRSFATPSFCSKFALCAVLCMAGCGDSSNQPDGGTGGDGDGAGHETGGGPATGGGGGSSTGGSGTGGQVSSDGDGDFMISPPYMAAPETFVNDQVPQGAVYDFTMSSTDSAIYPTAFATGQDFTRAVAVYVPQQYVPGTEAPFMVVQDGVDFYRYTMAPVLDNMIADGRLPPMIAIFVQPGPDDGTPDGERSFEYDSVSDTYVNFVEMELLPKIEQDYGVSLTTDPEGRGAMGGSSGGAAAFTMGWFRTDLYHRLLTYSGSFCDLQPSAEYPNGAWEYHESLIASTSAKPLRVALAVSDGDLDWNTDTDQMRNWEDANRAMAAALKDKGYHYRFVFATGATHIDYDVMQQTLPETLEWLWQGYGR